MSLSNDIPLVDLKPSGEGHLEPSKLIKNIGIPESCVACFFNDVLKNLKEVGKLKPIAVLKSEIGKNPVFEIDFHGKKVTVFHSGVGAPLAAGFLEEVIALGGKKFMACGGAGVLDSTIPLGTVIIPSSAVRDEGTSFHYLAPSREVAIPESETQAIKSILEKHKVPYKVGKSWTTDAFYRETKERINLRRSEGCITVEMEVAAFFAVAQFRKIKFGHILYGGDDVGSALWDSRDWSSQTSVREKLFWLAVEASLIL